MKAPFTPARCRLFSTALFLFCLSVLTSAAQVIIAPLDIKCPTNITVWTCGQETPVQYPPPQVTGGCGDNRVICQPPSGSVFALGVTEVTCRVVDGCQNTDTCTFTVTVRRDTEPPVIRCPTNRVVVACPNAAGGCGAVVNYPAPVATDNSGSVAVVCQPPSGSVFACGVTTVTCRAVDRCDNKDECTFTVRVEPGQAPGIQCPSNLTILTCSNSAVVVYPPPVVNPAGTSVICNPPSGTVMNLGAHVVNCVASNQCGTTECEFTVVVRPVPPPVIQCPTNPIVLTVSCATNCVPAIYPLPAVSNGALLGCNPPPGTCLTVGVHTVTCVATNLCRERDVCRFEVRVIEGQGQPPVIRCPQDMVVVACSNDCAVVHYPAPAVVNGALAKCDPPSGSCLPVGETIVRCYATNACAEVECKFTVTVLKDDPRPRLSIKRDGRFVVICWPKTCACYKLQSTSSLNPPIVWTDVAVTPDDGFDSWCVRLPIDRRHRFFRLIKCDQQTAPFYSVLETGITRGQAGALAEALGIPQDELTFADGSVRFINPKKFQVVPTKPIQDQGIIDELRRGNEDEGGEMAFEAFDFDAIKSLRLLGEEEASETFRRAILRAGIGPKPEDPATIGPKPEDPIVRHTTLEVVDTNGRSLLDNAPIDTHVLYQFNLGGIPLTGPGSNLRVSFGPGGEPTSLNVSLRKLELAGEIPIISVDEAARRCRERYPNLGANARPRLVYFAPEIQMGLLLPAVQKVLPCYECGGDAPVGGQTVSLMQTIIPATDDPDLVPNVILEATAQGNLVNAKATVRGGTPPYRFQWSSSSTDLSGFPEDASSIEYEAQVRDEQKTDTVRVTVIDANGIPVSASKPVEVEGGIVGPMFMAAVGGVVDYGTERAVSDMGFGIQSGFNARMSSGGALRRFNFSGVGCWERDFKQGGTGLDHIYTDNVDLTFYIGHGYGGGFTFESNKDDGEIYYTDTIGDWGNGDMEWLALTSCQVLKDTWGGKKWWDRWIPDFDGLHIMLGFETNAHDWDQFGRVFADWMHGRYGIFPPMRVKDAWFLAKSEQQPSGNIAVAIGVVGPGGCHNVNDYFHGRGPVGPDIRKNQVQGCWRLNFQ
jgi:hypothetical protein